LAALEFASPKIFQKRKNLAKIYYASLVIAHFILNFVVMATEVEREKMQLTAFDGAFPKTPAQ